MIIPENCAEVFHGKTNVYVLMLHALGLNRTCFRKAQEELKRHEISHLSIDLPGHGFSRETHASTYRDAVNYITAILAREKIGKVVAFGHSLGGMVALSFNRYSPDTLAGLVLVASCYELSWKTLRASFVLIGYPICISINGLVRLFCRQPDPKMDFSDERCRKSDLAILWRSSKATGRRGAAMAGATMKSESLRTELERLVCPALLVWPARDQIFTNSAYATISASPQVETIKVDSSHNSIGCFPSAIEHMLSESCNLSGAIAS